MGEREGHLRDPSECLRDRSTVTGNLEIDAFDRLIYLKMVVRGAKSPHIEGRAISTVSQNMRCTLPQQHAQTSSIIPCIMLQTSHRHLV